MILGKIKKLTVRLEDGTFLDFKGEGYVELVKTYVEVGEKKPYKKETVTKINASLRIPNEPEAREVRSVSEDDQDNGLQGDGSLRGTAPQSA